MEIVAEDGKPVSIESVRPAPCISSIFYLILICNIVSLECLIYFSNL